jgi:hypothetical protein
MATNTKLAPFRQYNESDVLNLFVWSGEVPVTAGTIVAPQSTSGWRSDEATLQILGTVGQSYGNTVSPRWGGRALVKAAATGDPVLGMLLYDVREVDENGMPLKFYPQKAAENNWTLSGHVSPILTRGFVLISGANANGTPTPGAVAYPSGDGKVVIGSLNQNATSKVGKFYGSPDSKGYTLLYVDVG